jgi:hypothetical protein
VRLRNLAAYLNLPARARQMQARRRIYSAEEFRTILGRERARANRNGHGFSLISFDVGSPDTTSARRLLHMLTYRVRSTDEVGWLDRRCVGVILPYTLPAGAWKLADDLYQLMSNEISPPVCTVYTHPFQRSWDGNHHAE